jgi:iron(III) transport system permease protein
MFAMERLRKTVYLFVWVVLAGLFVAPLANLVSRLNISAAQAALSNSTTVSAIINTLHLSFTVALLSVVLGACLAWVLNRTDLPGRNMFLETLSLPYSIPPFVGAIGWIILANPQSGILNQFFNLNMNVYSFSGLVFVETSFIFAFAMMTTSSSLSQMDPSLEEAARVSGATPLQVLKDISLPLLMPNLITSFVVAFVATAASFGVPAMIGGPARIYFMTTQIYQNQRMATEAGLNSSIAISAMLMAGTFLILFLSQKWSQKSFAMVSGKTAKPSIIRLGPLRPFVALLVAAFAFVVFILPMGSVVLSAFSEVQGKWSFTNLGLNNFYRVFNENQETLPGIFNSLWLALVCSTIVVLFSFVVSYMTTKTNYSGRRISNTVLGIPFSTPGTVLALALILTFSQGYFGLGPSLYNTFGLLIIAYFLKYFSVGHASVQNAFQQIHISLEEASLISGANWIQTLRHIYLPLLRLPMLTAMFLVFMPVLSELTMSVLLTGPGLETIGTMIFSLQEYSDVGGGGAAVLSTIILAFVVCLRTLIHVLRNIQKGTL